MSEIAERHVRVISPVDYFMGRDVSHKAELTPEIIDNANSLLAAVNHMFEVIGITEAEVTSGWRPASINKKVGGALRSYHLQGKAVDIADPRGHLAYRIIQHHQLLDVYGLWLEFPTVTPGWVHLDTGKRSPRGVRTFLP